MADEEVISVEIHGQRYPIRSALDREYVARLATYVDEKMRAAADSTPTGDALRLAVLAALNVADELFRCRDVNKARDRRAGRARRRAGTHARPHPDGVLTSCTPSDGTRLWPHRSGRLTFEP